MRPQFIGDHVRQQELVPLFQLVSVQANRLANGLVTYLDTMDYSNCPDIRDDFKCRAFFWRKGNSLIGVPTHLLSMMQHPNTSYIIWLSKDLLDSSITHVIWVYAHEFRHFMQACGAVNLMPFQNFLIEQHRVEGFSGTGTQLEKPDELDCELFAKRVAKELIGEEAFLQYLGECRSTPGGESYFCRLLQLEQFFHSSTMKTSSSTDD